MDQEKTPQSNQIANEILSSDKETQKSKPKGRPRTLNCPSCGGTVTVKAVGISVTVVCSYCSAVIDVNNEQCVLILQQHSNTQKTCLELGDRGTFDGKTWEIIGYVLKGDGAEYTWEEYLLFNPYYGFRFLVQADGHWNSVTVLRETLSDKHMGKETIPFQNTTFRLFNMGIAVVLYVKGEFYWRVKEGDTVSVADYIAPPLMLSIEIDDQEVNASLCTYITPETVASAFGKDPFDLPDRGDVFPNQPNPHRNKGSVFVVFFLALFALIVLQLVTISRSDQEHIVQSAISIDPKLHDETTTIPTFSISKPSNLLIRTTSPLINGWAEIALSLVNTETQQSYNITQAISFYQGYGSDGSWSEGSQHTASYTKRLPAGEYKILIDTESSVFQENQPLALNFTIIRDVPIGSNFWLVGFLIMLYPLAIFIMRRKFEAKRWEMSGDPDPNASSVRIFESELNENVRDGDEYGYKNTSFLKKVIIFVILFIIYVIFF